MMVPIRANAVSGVYCSPSQRARASPPPKLTSTATYGEPHLRPVRPNADGSTRMRPMAHCVRVEARPPPLAQAALEFSSAMNSTIQPAPHTVVAIRFHGLPPPPV